MAAVGGLEDASAGQDESRFFANKVDVVDGVVNTEWTFGPVGATIFGKAEKTRVAADPTTFGVGEIDSIQIFTPRADPLGSPAALRATNHRSQTEYDREHQ